jgi:hypothetical protein
MYLAFHMPMFGTPNVDSKPIECPTCPRTVSFGANDWQDKDISTCNPGDQFVCNRCGTVVTVMWGLEEPDHLSTWMNAERCPHRLCRIKFTELKATKGWSNEEEQSLKQEHGPLPAEAGRT